MSFKTLSYANLDELPEKFRTWGKVLYKDTYIVLLDSSQKLPMGIPVEMMQCTCCKNRVSILQSIEFCGMTWYIHVEHWFLKN